MPLPETPVIRLDEHTLHTLISRIAFEAFDLSFIAEESYEQAVQIIREVAIKQRDNG